MDTPTLHFCCDCATVCGDLDSYCWACGSDRVHPVEATDAGLAAVMEGYAAGHLDDLVFETIEEALRATIAEMNAEADEREAAEPAKPGYVKLRLVELTYKEAMAFIAQHHRHHKPPKFWRFGLGVVDEVGTLRGVAVVATPVARMIATREPGTLEVTRLATDGTRNACSMLYAACFKAMRRVRDPLTKKPVYDKLITYILASETGTTLRAAGWRKVADVRGKSWNSKARTRVDKAPTCNKTRWERAA